jgi:DeoR/GlpR family transcriptional regulator of sugar metabolism
MHTDAVPPGDKRHAKIVELFQEGMTPEEIKRRFRVSYWTVRNELRAEAKKRKVKSWRDLAPACPH